MGNNNICKYELLLRISSSFLLFYIPVDLLSIMSIKRYIYLPGIIIRLTHRTIVESHTGIQESHAGVLYIYNCFYKSNNKK